MHSSTEEKSDSVIWQGPVGDSAANQVDIESDGPKKKSTAYDRAAMWRMGKTQELRVRITGYPEQL